MFFGTIIAQYLVEMVKHFKKIFITFLVILVSILLGYVLRLYHEGRIRAHYQSQAEKEMVTLEEEFHSAWKKPHKFYIFNGSFEVYPLKESEKTFCYKETKEGNLKVTDAKKTRNTDTNK